LKYLRSERGADGAYPLSLRFGQFGFVAFPAGKGAITEIPNKEEFPWHLLLLPVKWTA
jgi:hypothetical protein